MALTRNFALQVSANEAEASYDTAATVDQRININIGDIPQETTSVISDDDKVGGTEEASDSAVFAQQVTFDVGINRVKPFAVGFLASYALGTSTAANATGASAVYQHAISPASGATTLGEGGMNSFTFEAWKTSSVKTRYTGGMVNSFSLSANRGANRMVNMNASIIASGTTATASTAAKTEPDEAQLNAATSNVWIKSATAITDRMAVAEQSAANRSQTLDTSSSDLTSPTSIASTTRSISWDYDNGINPDDLYRVGGGNVLAVGERSGRSQTVTIDFDYSDDTYIDAMNAQTDYAIQWMVRGAAHASDSNWHGFNIIWPYVRIQSLEVADDNGTLVNRAVFNILEDTSSDDFHSVYLDVFNDVENYI